MDDDGSDEISYLLGFVVIRPQWFIHDICDEIIVIQQLRRRQEQMMKSLEQQEAEFLEMKKAFIAERDTWEEQIKQHEAELTRFASFQ